MGWRATACTFHRRNSAALYKTVENYAMRNWENSTVSEGGNDYKETYYEMNLAGKR